MCVRVRVCACILMCAECQLHAYAAHSRVARGQMAVSLLFAQKEMTMRHYDVKLLNFFLKSEPAAGASDGGAGGAGAGRDPFWEPEARRWVVKLADYGTAETDAQSMTEPLENRHVTTWENVLPAFLLYGDAARQGFASDIHALGLCLLHLCTGEAPYEETVEELECPRALALMLRKAWLAREVKGKKRGANVGRGGAGGAGGGGAEKGSIGEEKYRWVAKLLADTDEDDFLLQVRWRDAVCAQ